MPDAFTPIRAFGDQIALRLAYRWQQAEIFQFLEEVVTNPDSYEVPVAQRPFIATLRDEIVALHVPWALQLLLWTSSDLQDVSSDGPGFQEPEPSQQLRRIEDPDEGEVVLNPTDPIPWDTNNKQERFFIIFDLLGILLSLLGPAPSNATAKNFFLPLVVVYAKWCCVLSSDPHLQESYPEPYAAQITWASRGQGDPRYFFIGASIAGFSSEQPWPNTTRQRRWEYITHSIGGILGDYPGFNNSPHREMNRQAGTRFGNCGETYPFLYLLTDAGMDLTNHCHGIAFCVAATGYLTVYNGRSFWDRGFMRPCVNCEYLLQDLYGVNPDHFKKNALENI